MLFFAAKMHHLYLKPIGTLLLHFLTGNVPGAAMLRTSIELNKPFVEQTPLQTTGDKQNVRSESAPFPTAQYILVQLILTAVLYSQLFVHETG